MIAANVTDDGLIAGSTDGMTTMTTEINDRFLACKAVIDDKINLNRSIMSQHKDGNIYL